MKELSDPERRMARIMELEPDIRAKAGSRRWAIPGYDQEDLAQEFRIALWLKLPQYDPSRGALLRTFAQSIMESRFKDLLRHSLKGQIRYVTIR